MTKTEVFTIVGLIVFVAIAMFAFILLSSTVSLSPMLIVILSIFVVLFEDKTIKALLLSIIVTIFYIMYNKGV